jgi:hypothetical protein
VATAIVVAPGRRVAMVRPDHDETTIARAAIVAARPDRAVARHGPKASAAGPWAARDRIFAGAMPVIGARRRCRCPKLT